MGSASDARQVVSLCACYLTQLPQVRVLCFVKPGGRDCRSSQVLADCSNVTPEILPAALGDRGLTLKSFSLAFGSEAAPFLPAGLAAGEGSSSSSASSSSMASSAGHMLRVNTQRQLRNELPASSGPWDMKGPPTRLLCTLFSPTLLRGLPMFVMLSSDRGLQQDYHTSPSLPP